MDEAVLRRLAQVVGGELGSVYGKKGKADLDHKITGYNQAAHYTPWVILRDMNQDDDCPVLLRNRLLPTLAPKMCFRIVVRAVEAWLLADRASIAKFLGISVSLVPTNPESLLNPKDTLINLVQRSRRSNIREDMLPKPGSGRPVGPAYATRMIEFVDRHWQPGAASRTSDSLARCIRCWKNLVSSRSLM